MRVRWLEAARVDLQRIGRFIALDRPAAAKTTVARIQRAAVGLGMNPDIGRPGVIATTRELILPSLPYFIVYRVRDASIEILWIVDGRQNWPEGFDVTTRLAQTPQGGRGGRLGE